MVADLSAFERTLEQVIEDHVGDYTTTEVVKRQAGDPLEVRDIPTGQTFLVEVRALPSGG